jgi:hypothetical protein
MKQHISTSIKLIPIGILFAGAINYVHATVGGTPPANPPANNTPFPIHVGAQAQEKPAGLGVDSFNALQAAQFESNLYLEGIVRGGDPSLVNSTVKFGQNAGVPPFVDALITGELAAQQGLRADTLANTYNRSVCADSAGKLILCESMPTVVLLANPNPVTSGSTTNLTVNATRFSAITSCEIDHGIGQVTMGQLSAGVWQNTSAALSGAITEPTLFAVTCRGTSLSGTYAEVSATRLVGVNNGSSGYYAHCFIADTQVTMADGSKKNIQDVQIGDVLKGDTTDNTVLGYHQPTLDDGKLYGFNGGEAFVTAEHPFMTTKGWKSINPEKTKKEHIGISVTTLEIGDVLVTEKGFVTIKSIQSKDAPTTTKLYNFILDGDHTYYADGYLVHNKELCNAQYPACPSNGICIDQDGVPTPNGGSCAVQCTPGQPVSGGYCKPGDILACSAQGYKICL